jgi:hypothetical protein
VKALKKFNSNLLILSVSQVSFVLVLLLLASHPFLIRVADLDLRHHLALFANASGKYPLALVVS